MPLTIHCSIYQTCLLSNQIERQYFQGIQSADRRKDRRSDALTSSGDCISTLLCADACADRLCSAASRNQQVFIDGVCATNKKFHNLNTH